MPLLGAMAAAVAFNCWVEAALRFDVPPQLLSAIASVESSYDPNAIAYARNGTYSVGLMQINSSWFQKLKGVGISETDLRDPCTNVYVGAWILSRGVARYGYSWQAIGAYYAGPYDQDNYSTKLADYRQYSNKVLRRWSEALSDGRTITPGVHVGHIQAASRVTGGGLDQAATH